jgi:hypothetical protein
MRTRQLLLRSGPVAAAAVALAAAPAAGAPGISVSTTGSSVSVTTSACTQLDGEWGTASLLTSKQTNFSQGRQVALSGTAELQSAAWSGIGPGTYTVIVICSNGTTAGSQAVIVAPPSTPTISATSAPTPSPTAGVMGGLGGGIKDYGPVTLGVGAALVGTGGIAAVYFLRRRTKPHRL